MHHYLRTEKAFTINIGKIKRRIDIQLTFISEINIQYQYFFKQHATRFSPDYAYTLNYCLDVNVQTYVTIQELTKKAFTGNSQNKKEAIGMQFTFILEINLQKQHF